MATIQGARMSDQHSNSGSRSHHIGSLILSGLEHIAVLLVILSLVVIIVVCLDTITQRTALATRVDEAINDTAKRIAEGLVPDKDISTEDAATKWREMLDRLYTAKAIMVNVAASGEVAKPYGDISTIKAVEETLIASIHPTDSGFSDYDSGIDIEWLPTRYLS
jgi:hypothetical protein